MAILLGLYLGDVRHGGLYVLLLPRGKPLRILSSWHDLLRERGGKY